MRDDIKKYRHGIVTIVTLHEGWFLYRRGLKKLVINMLA